MIENRAVESIQTNGMSSPSQAALSRVQLRAKNREGLYAEAEGKNIGYKDRMNVQKVFTSGYAGCVSDKMDYN